VTRFGDRKLFHPALVVSLATTLFACAGGANDRPSPPDPGFVVADNGERLHLAAKYPLSAPQDFEAVHPELRAAMRWYIEAMPSARPEEWVKARDLIFDWLEGDHNPLQIVPNMAVLGPPERDHRWKFSAYVRGVYLSGKTLYVLDHPEATGTMAAELAGVDAMLRFHEITRKVDPMGISPKLRRYARKRRRGTLEAYLAKRMAKAPPSRGRR